MRNVKNINLNWMFLKENVSFDLLTNKNFIDIDLPHTWNGIDGQDGGNDYIRDKFWYKKNLSKIDLPECQKYFIEFNFDGSILDGIKIFITSQFSNEYIFFQF